VYYKQHKIEIFVSNGRLHPTECVTDLDYQSKLLIFELILTSFKPSIIFGGSWGSTENWLEPKTKPPLRNLTCPNQ